MQKVKRKLPDWFKVKFPAGENFHELKEKFSKASLNTVCEEAACPNIADCWDRKTATFMILWLLILILKKFSIFFLFLIYILLRFLFGSNEYI